MIIDWLYVLVYSSDILLLLAQLLKIAKLIELIFIAVPPQHLLKRLFQLHWKDPVGEERRKAVVMLAYVNLGSTIIQSLNYMNLLAIPSPLHEVVPYL